MSKNYYKILGINRDATNQEIKSTYRELAKRWHPDVCKEPNAHEMFVEISEAYEILVNPIKRQQYDQYFSYEQQSKRENNRENQYGNDNRNYESYRKAQEDARRKAQEYANYNIEDFMYTVLGIVFKIGEKAGKAVVYGLEGEDKQDGSKVSLIENFFIGVKGVLLIISILLIVSIVASPVGVPLGILTYKSLWHKGRFVGILPLILNTVIVGLIFIVILIIFGIYIFSNL